MASFLLWSVAITAFFAWSAAAGKPTCPTKFSWEENELTDAAIANTDPVLFNFGNNAGFSQCKAFPGDASWPSPATWDSLNQTLGGALIQTVPLAAPCYRNWPQYDAAACQYIREHWGDPNLHINDPTSAMFPIYQGRTCMPTEDPDSSNCTLGGYASYSVAVTTVSQIQLALNFARNTNVRLVVKNTGHDFADKSIGAGALSIWTHKLKDIQFLADYDCGRYRGPAFKLASGVVTEEVYKAAEQNNVTVAGGECRVSISLGSNPILGSKY
jgi:hypothetical protein